MLVVSDNSPLQYLILIDCIDILPKLYGSVLTTQQVLAELRHPGTPAKVRDWTHSGQSWLHIDAPKALTFVATLDLGEASAISLAQERGADLILIDERAGTEVARGAGFEVIGTLGILIEAGVEGLIDFEVALTRLTTETPFYASKGLMAAARRIYLDRKAGATD